MTQGSEKGEGSVGCQKMETVIEHTCTKPCSHVNVRISPKGNEKPLKQGVDKQTTHAYCFHFLSTHFLLSPGFCFNYIHDSSLSEVTYDRTILPSSVFFLISCCGIGPSCPFFLLVSFCLWLFYDKLFLFSHYSFLFFCACF